MISYHTEKLLQKMGYNTNVIVPKADCTAYVLFPIAAIFAVTFLASGNSFVSIAAQSTMYVYTLYYIVDACLKLAQTVDNRYDLTFKTHCKALESEHIFQYTQWVYYIAKYAPALAIAIHADYLITACIIVSVTIIEAGKYITKCRIKGVDAEAERHFKPKYNTCY